MSDVTKYIDESSLKEVIENAWQKAFDKRRCLELGVEDPGGNLGQKHKRRSEEWIDQLGKGFEEYYNDENDRAFWRGKSDPRNQKEFKLQEMLYDVAICHTGRVESVKNTKPLTFISKCYWQIESEFEKDDSREIVKDMSKLVMGSGENKLFVAVKKDGDWEDRILTMCKDIAECCSGGLYFVFIVHPEKWNPNKWDQNEDAPSVYKWEKNDWRPL